jgi:hypothetical protein
VRGANSEVAESSKKAAKRVKSPKSKSPAPPMPPPPPLSAPENEDPGDAILQLKGHEAEVCNYAPLRLATNLELIRSLCVRGTLLATIY